MFRRGSPFVRPFNHIITERINFITMRLIDKETLFKKICSDHLFPQDADVSAIFAPLHMKAVSFFRWCSIIATLKGIHCFVMIRLFYKDGGANTVWVDIFNHKTLGWTPLIRSGLLGLWMILLSVALFSLLCEFAHAKYASMCKFKFFKFF